jgi:hypothetical protein
LTSCERYRARGWWGGRARNQDSILVSRKADRYELSPPVLARALEPFPGTVRTLDALHLASVEFLRNRGQSVELATYDKRLMEAAQALGIPLFRL